MLPLLNRLIVLPGSYVIGVAVDREGICIAISSRGGDSVKLHRIQELNFESSDIGNELSEANGQFIAKTVRQLIDSEREKYMYAKINISASDAIIRNFVVDLDSIPKNKKELDDLVTWRISDLLDVQENSIVCRSQVLGKNADKWLVFCQAVDAGWLKVIENCLSNEGVMVWNINSAHYYLHNDLYQSEPGGASILVSISAENWTIAIVNEHGNPIKLITRRLRVSDEIEDIGYMASEILRLLESYEYIYKNTISTINVEGTHNYAYALVEQLGQVMTCPINYLRHTALPVHSSSVADSRLVNAAIIASQLS